MHHDDMDSQVRTYMRVFGALMVLTVVTVGASHVELATGPAIALGLGIALVKGSLVACYFMHLMSEKAVLLWMLAAVLFLGLLALLGPVITEGNNLHMGR